MDGSLKWPDYLIMAGFLTISMAIGLYHSLTGGRQKTSSEFIMANRRLKVVPTAISLFVSHQSAILILGMTAEVYNYGVQLIVIGAFSFVISGLVVQRLIVPWIHPLRLVSVNEYVYLRFQSKVVKIFASILGIISCMLYMGIAMYAPSAALESVTGLPLKLSIPLMAAVCITYTTLGGMRAVIWTDVFQALTIVGGLIAIIVKGIIVTGGVTDIIKYATEEGRLYLVNWNPDPTIRLSFWSIIIGYTFLWIHVYGLYQASVQRYSATQTVSQARKIILLGFPGNVFMTVVSGFTGVVVLAYYSKIRCDPLLNKDIHNVNQFLPHFVMKLFSDSPGFAGLFLATLYGAALSSVSSSLSGSAANCWEDILKGYFTRVSEAKKAILNRLLVVVFGLLATSVSFLVATLPGPISQISAAFSGSVDGPLFGIFMLGGLSKYPNWKGALSGGLAGLSLNLWLNLGSITVPKKYPNLPPISIEGCSRNDSFSSPFLVETDSWESSSVANTNITEAFTMDWTPDHQGLQRFYCLSFMWYVPIALLTTLVVGFAVSFISKDKNQEESVDDRLLIKFKINSGSTVSAEKAEPILTQDGQPNAETTIN